MLGMAVPQGRAAPEALCIWTGAVSAYWNDPGNWDSCPGGIPGSADDVGIVYGQYTRAPYLDISTTIHQLDVNVQTHLTAASGITLTATIANISGHFTGPGALVVLGTWRWGAVAQVTLNDGLLDGGGTIVIGNSGHGYLSGYADTCRMDDFTLINNGIVETGAPATYGWVSIDGAAIHNYDLWVSDGQILDANHNSTFTNHPGATLQVANHTQMSTALINDGVVDVIDPAGGYPVDATALSICRGGTQSGEYKGTNDALLTFGACRDGVIVPTTFTFASGSKVTTPRVTFNQPGQVHGTYGPVGTTSASYLYAAVTFYADAAVTGFGDMLSVYAPVTVLGTAPQYQVDLEVTGSAANFSYAGTINVTHEFECNSNGKVSGGGLIRVMPTATLRPYACTLDAKQVENQGTAWWSNYTITGVNNATLVNKGTFNLGGGDLITGSMTLSNTGLLSKNHASTTTIAVPFDNAGTIQILLGEIVFTGDVTLPETSTTTIAGTLEVVELTNNGILTVTGTVDGDLTNYGTLNLKGTVTGDLVNDGQLSPGTSPGLANVTGCFTQTAEGSLKIELSKAGSTPVQNPIAGTDFDQVQVSERADLAGELILIAGDTLAVRPSAELAFLTATGGINGTFGSQALDEMLPGQLWTLVYRVDQVVVRFNPMVYLPLVVSAAQ